MTFLTPSICWYPFLVSQHFSSLSIQAAMKYVENPEIASQMLPGRVKVCLCDDTVKFVNAYYQFLIRSSTGDWHPLHILLDKDQEIP